MNITTERLLLRAIEPEDNAVLLELINDETTEKALGGWSFPVSSAAQADWIKNRANNANTLRCMICEKDKPEKAYGTVILSSIDFKNGTGEIHIKLLPTARGKGFGPESITAVTKYAFDHLRLNCVYAIILTSNEASKKTFEKCGFKLDGILRSRVYKSGVYNDVAHYSALKGEI